MKPLIKRRRVCKPLLHSELVFWVGAIAFSALLIFAGVWLMLDICDPLRYR